MAVWFDDEDFWRLMEPVLFSRFRDEEATRVEVEGLLQLAQPKLGGDVLDIPCGTGRHAVALARRGFAVTGVDRTALYLERARSRAAEAGVEVELVEQDMRAFSRPQSFDLAINLFTSFGYFEDEEEDQRLLECFRASLRPGGVLVMEMHGKEQLCRDFRERDWHRLEDDGGESYLLEERHPRHDWSWIDTTWILVRDGVARRFTFGLRLYSGAELRRALEASGFSAVRLFGGLDGSPYDHEAERLVAVARR